VVGDAAALVEDGERAIEALVDGDAGFRIAPAARAWGDIDEVGAEADRIVVIDRGGIVKAADGIEVQVCGDGAPSGAGLGRRFGEAAVEARQKSGEDPVRLFQGGGVREAELDHEPVLTGAPQPLDAAFRLRRLGANPLDPELMNGAADLGGDMVLAAELVSEGGFARSAKDGVAVAVDGGGQPMRAAEGRQKEEVALGVLLEAEVGKADVAGGIVDGPNEDQTGAAVFHPGMVTAIDLDEQAGHGPAVAPAAMPGRATGPRTAQPYSGEDPVHGTTT
jgi:hypothetical protein